MPLTENPPHITSFQDNMAQISRLLEIHGTIAGPDPGYKHGVEILNKSAVVLLVACWEAFVEDLAADAFTFMLETAPDPSVIPAKVLALAGAPLKASEDQRAVWRLAGDGWKRVLLAHQDTVIDRLVGKLNTPRPGQVDEIFEALIGLRSLSTTWKWRGMPNDRVIPKLDGLVELRGEIAHRVSAADPVYKATVVDHIDFVKRLAVKTHNQVIRHLAKISKDAPWPALHYGDIA